MSGVKRYEHAGDYCGPQCGFEESADGDWVFASDYDALAQRCRELEACIAGDHPNLVALLRVGQAKAERERNTLRAEVERLQSEMEDLTFALSDAEHCAENAGRNASAFEDRMGDLQVENGKLRAEVEQLQATVDRLESAYLAWQEKTDWVQRGISDGSLSAKYLGWHRADILKAEIERLTAGQQGTLPELV